MPYGVNLDVREDRLPSYDKAHSYDVQAWSNYRIGRLEVRFIILSTLGYKYKTS